MTKVKQGDVFDTNSCGQCEVVEYVNAHEVYVKFLNTGSTAKVAAGNLRRGLVRDVFARTVEGVGYFGDGPYKARFANQSMTKEYAVWSQMLRRCYDPQDSQTARAYECVTVHPDWHNFQVFAEWCQGQIGFGMDRFHLDKDLLVKGNREYGPGKCVFLPAHVNAAITETKHTNSSGHCGVYRQSEGAYIADVTLNGGSFDLGSYRTAEQAALVYRAVKEAYVRALADVYKDAISEQAYVSLKNWSAT